MRCLSRRNGNRGTSPNNVWSTCGLFSYSLILTRLSSYVSIPPLSPPASYLHTYTTALLPDPFAMAPTSLSFSRLSRSTADDVGFAFPPNLTTITGQAPESEKLRRPKMPIPWATATRETCRNMSRKRKVALRKEG